MNRCSGCGFPVQEGKQFCPVCEGTSPNGTAIYLKFSKIPGGENLKMELYEQWLRYRRAVDKED